jgi:Family of unknown function (DUF5691)
MNWAALLADALVGTDRRTSVDPVELLDQSAAAAAFRRAGTRPLAAPDSPSAPAAPETRLLVGDSAASRLEMLLEGGLDSVLREAVLQEWLELARDRGRRVPPELLPALLGHGRAHVWIRPLIAEVGGARVHWLAEQNPEWTYLTHEVEETADPQAWETGSHAQRRGYLGALRRRDPAAARTLLTDEWATLAASERADLLLMLATGLGVEDEPLLESALDDKRKEVRIVAADLLVILPGSAYQERATVRARHHVAAAATQVNVRLPEACDPAMRRDGIAPKPPAGTGERAWWLEEILARAPLSAWPLPPAALVSRLRDNEWAPTVHRGLARAAAVHRDSAWAAALLDALGGEARDREIAAALYPLLPVDEIVARATRALAAGTVAGLGPLLENCPRPWPPELSRLVLNGFAELARRSKVRGELYLLARLAALRLPVTAAEVARELAESLGQVEGVDCVPLEMLARTLFFRHEMTQEIA